ncbi:MAG TPA: chromosome segregation ATPase, partial [Cyanobacteria bacterium UBA11049]|nr:chromosome segregation ATPase [Cyanobacteria bacterium UBA11049]
MPEDWSTGHPPNIEDASSQQPQTQLPGAPGSQPPEDAGDTFKRIPRQKVNSAPKTRSEMPSSGSSNSSKAKRSWWAGSSLPPKGKPSAPTDTTSHKRWKNWMLWAAVAALASNSVAFIAVAVLLKLPSAPNCPSIFWPLASGSVRLHCAQVAASKQTVVDLLEAIALVKALPKDHPMQAEINRYVQQWSQDILILAEDRFQAGKLNDAIAIANKIPQDNGVNNLVNQQISKWRSIWSEAESIYTAAEAEIPEQHWRQAFMTAVRLLNVGNEYWENTKYDELKYKIESARVDGDKLVQAEALANQGGIKNLLAALKLVNSVDKDSYMYQKAQERIPDYGRKMLDLAQTNLDRKNADEAIDIANQIPPISDLEMEVQDFITIAQAKRSSFAGTVPSIETAIMTAQKLGTDRPLYNQAQELIARWQLEIEDVQHLDKARELALPGTVADLSAAIAEASMIPDTNPRIQEARQEINRWQAQVQTFEDQPYLDQAEQMALSGQISD